MSYTIETANIADAARMATLHYLSHTTSFAAFATPEFVATRKIENYVVQWADFLSAQQPGARGWVARIGADVVGMVRIQPMPERGLAQLAAMHVHPDYQGQGIGRALMTTAEAFIKASGYRHCILGVVEANPRARRLYEGMGWKSIERHPKGVEGVPYCVYEKLFGDAVA